MTPFQKIKQELNKKIQKHQDFKYNWKRNLHRDLGDRLQLKDHKTNEKNKFKRKLRN